MAGFNDNYTLEAASDGREFMAPDIYGVPSVKVTLRSAESDIFRRAKAVELASLAGSLAGVTDPIERARLVEASVARSVAYLFAGWELEQECTPVTALELLQSRPYLIEWADKQSVRAADFFVPASTA